MIRTIFAAMLVWIVAWPTGARAQDTVWVQVEALPTLSRAQDRVRAYDARLDDVSGYFIGGTWYGIVLGPYARSDAALLLRQLRSQGVIPGDSFLVDGSTFRQQFWPVGVGAATEAQPLPSSDRGQDVAAVEETPIIPADESPREARASEAALDRTAREELQIALRWAGFYDAAIDGSFGRGTRSAMTAWQVANNYEPTGILTSAQRVALLQSYNAVLDGMDLQLVQDDATGIAIQIPTGVVEFAEYEPPFARFDAVSNDLPAQVLLISQEGDQNRLFGLYEILQTLAVVPQEGERSRSDRGFTINAADETVQSYTTATLQDGQIKGFMLVWPAGDRERFRRVLDEMRGSFARTDGVLDPGIAPVGEDQAIDLVAGLAVRQPMLSRSGFFIDRRGTVLTTTEVVGECDRLTLDAETEAEVVHRDDALGLVVLRPIEPLAPVAVAEFQTAVPRLQSEIAVAGYPYGGVLAAPSLTFGQVADMRGLQGEEEFKRLALAAQEGDAGGPVFDTGGAVLGMLLPRGGADGRVLPADVSFSLDADEIIASLSAAGVEVQTTDAQAFMAPETLTLRAADQTVLVSCW